MGRRCRRWAWAPGVPNFHTPEACADAIAAALARRTPQPIRRPSRARSRAPAGRDNMLDELAAGALLERLGIARAPSVALDADIDQAPPLPFPYPVAVKLLSAEIAHKSDVGGVVLGVADGGRCSRRSKKSAPRSRTNAPARASHACWCSRWNRGARRGAPGLSRRARRRPARHGGGGRRAHRDRARPQPATGAGRARRRAQT